VSKTRVSNDKESLAKAKQIQELIQRANGGDESVMPMIRNLLDQAPPLISFMGGDLAEQAQESLINAIAGSQLAMKESLLRKLSQLREDIGGTNPSPIERLLIERVVACWLQLQHADCLFAQVKEVSFRQGDYMQRHQDRSHRRYLSALKTLATVRKLVMPIQLDVNVSGELKTESREARPSRSTRFADSSCLN